MALYESTAQIIDQIAEDLRHRAELLERHAKNLRETDDLEHAVLAMQDALNTSNQRYDLLMSRPIRDLQRAAERSAKD